MQFTSAIAASVIAFAALVSAQSPAELAAQIPGCASGCIATAVPAAGCSLGDYACQCAHSDAVAEAATPCLLKACSMGNALKVQSTFAEICKLQVSLSSSTPETVASTPIEAAAVSTSTMTMTSDASTTGSSSTPTSTSPSTSSAVATVDSEGSGVNVQMGMGVAMAAALAGVMAL